MWRAHSSQHAAPFLFLWQVASRFKAASLEPSFVLRLDTEGAGTMPLVPLVLLCTPRRSIMLAHRASCACADGALQSAYMQSDFANLNRLKEKLEQAAAELQQPYAKRITRYIR